jgi:hypothetical protein
MEDLELGISIGEKTPFIYKQVLSRDLVEKLNSYIDNAPLKPSIKGTLKFREKFDLSEELINEVSDELKVTLVDYFPDLKIYTMRIYVQTFGSIKRHTDVSFDGNSNLTCLVYLSDIDSGQLKLETDRYDDTSIEPDKKHLVFTITPKKHYGVIFKKNTIHWANDTYDKKILLMIDIHSNYI